MASSQTPVARPARFPSEYGQTPETLGELQEWSDVAARIAAAKNYWVATTTGDGRPHLRPVDGVFVDDRLAFGGSPETGWVRHLQERPDVSISLPDDDDAVILEGRVERVTDPDHSLVGAVDEANRAKYPQYFGEGAPQEFHPFWTLRPARVYAWSLSEFPRRATRFEFPTTH
jgi:hypothetical protein